MNPVEALERIADLLQRVRNSRQKAQAFRRAADAIRDKSIDELNDLVARRHLTDLPGIGKSTAAVITQALAGETPEYLRDLGESEGPATDRSDEVRKHLRGDLHLHSDWSDGGSTIEAMVEAAIELGHEYLALTDHSPYVRVAHGLDAKRLSEQLDVVAEINERVAPFRLLAGMEVDILTDGSLDMEDELLDRLDVVVGSVHSKLAMDSQPMTDRLIAALANPHVDILGHCTGRLIVGRGRAESTFDAPIVFTAAAHFDKAVEMNARPERLDPPMRLMPMLIESGAKVSIDSDAHATWQLAWQPNSCHRAAEAGVPVERIVNSWPVEELLAWTGSHGATAGTG